VVSCVCSLIRGQRRQGGADATADHQPPHGGQQARARGGALPPEGEPQRASATSGLPSFTYNRSVKHNVTGGGAGEEAATCSVCPGAFQVGETVRLLPVCLHLYHVECIDLWLEAHSSCPSAGQAWSRQWTAACCRRFKGARLLCALGRAPCFASVARYFFVCY